MAYNIYILLEKLFIEQQYEFSKKYLETVTFYDEPTYKKMFNNDWSAYVSGQGNEWKMLTDKQVAAFKAIYQKAYNSAAAGNKAAAAAKALEASDEYKKEYVQTKNAKKWSIQQDSTKSLVPE